MKLNALLTIFAFLLVSALPLRAGEVDAFKFLGYDIGDQFVVLNYEIPFDGMVEIRIFQEKEQLVWHGQYVNGRGVNKIRLKSSAFQSGIPYTLQLNYKQDVFRKDFTINR